MNQSKLGGIIARADLELIIRNLTGVPDTELAKKLALVEKFAKTQQEIDRALPTASPGDMLSLTIQQCDLAEMVLTQFGYCVRPDSKERALARINAARDTAETARDVIITLGLGLI